jgi:hypothetical protein
LDTYEHPSSYLACAGDYSSLIKLPPLENEHSLPSNVYVFMEWLLVKHEANFILVKDIVRILSLNTRRTRG